MKKQFLFSAICLSGLFFGQSFVTTAHPKVSEIQKNFKFKKYPKNLLSQFSKNIGADETETVEVFENVPGEVIGWKNDRGSYTTSETFQIKNGKLIEIETLPKSEKFLSGLNKFAPKNSHFQFASWGGRTLEPNSIKKHKNGNYILTAELQAVENGKTLEDDGTNSLGNYILEYQTSDFKNFKPTRIKNSKNKSWSNVN